MLFKDIPGFESIKNKLIKAVKSDHLAHALLFAGQEGSPNLNLALALATYLNCQNRGDNDACGECSSCKKSIKYIHPDMHFVFPVSSTKTITGKDVVSTSFFKDWRQFLLENPFGNVNDWNVFFGGENKQLSISREESRHIVRNLSLKAFEGNYKIMLIWLPEMMHVTAANAILKILEEPPEKTLFLLVSDDAENLLTTILSRTQLFNIRNFTDEEIRLYLTDNFQADESRASQAAHISNGNLNMALKVLNQVEDDSHRLFRDWMRLCYIKDYTEMVEWSDAFQKLNKLGQKSMFQYGLNIMREVLMLFFSKEKLSRMQGEELDFIENFGKVMNPEKVEFVTRQLNQAFYHLERNANPKILFLDLSLSIAKILRS